MLPLKYLSNFWRTLVMALIYCEINLDLNWSKNCVIAASDVNNEDAKFPITATKLVILSTQDVTVVTLSTQDNAELLEQLKSGCKKTINWNKYLSKISTERSNQYRLLN